MAINWLVLRTKRSPSLLLLLGDFKHAEREEEEEEKEAFVPAFWDDAQTRAFAAAAVRVVRLFFFLRSAFVACL